MTSNERLVVLVPSWMIIHCAHQQHTSSLPSSRAENFHLWLWFWFDYSIARRTILTFRDIRQSDRIIAHPAGKALGGTTVINGLYYIRGDKANYDAWERLGNPGWNWNTLLPYFLRTENFAIPTSAQQAARITYSQTRGYGSYPKTLDQEASVRESAARAYYEPIDGRQNLRIIQGTVKRITSGDSVSGSEFVATGVEHTDVNGNLRSVTVKREVIFLLDRSNIGTKVGLPGVGEGFQDQPLWVLMFQASNGFTGNVPSAAFANADDIFEGDTESIAAATRGKLATWSQAIAKRLNGGVSTDALIAEFEFFSQGDIIGSVFSPTLPFSWGSVHLNAAAEIDNPTIDPNFLSIGFDMRAALKVGKIARKIWDTQPLSKLAGTLLNPGEAALPLNATDAQWTEFLTSSVGPAFHCIGACAMLPREMGGVVDPTLKVYGTANVRVIDAPVISHLMSGHSSAAVYALAEKAADIIKKGHVVM
ncbi:glucose oxidase [Nemania sp. NC0429]|nr:glucose oxidase [Nemania sp. NC0429]